MRGNPTTETWQSVEDPERLIRNKNKEKINSSYFGASSFQYFHYIQDSEWETSVEILLSKSKSEYNLKKVEINPSRLESYLLYSLWKNLQTPVKTEQTTSTAQKFQLHTPPPIQNPPVFLLLPLSPNPPRPMGSVRFAPLALPIVLHDLLLNYS